jgi:hypothetical protein
LADSGAAFASFLLFSFFFAWEDFYHVAKGCPERNWSRFAVVFAHGCIGICGTISTLEKGLILGSRQRRKLFSKLRTFLLRRGLVYFRRFSFLGAEEKKGFYRGGFWEREIRMGSSSTLYWSEPLQLQKGRFSLH